MQFTARGPQAERDREAQVAGRRLQFGDVLEKFGVQVFQPAGGADTECA